MKVFILFYIVTSWEGVAIHREPDAFATIEQCIEIGEQLMELTTSRVRGSDYKCVETYK